jgi:hypothetical protein
VTTRLAGALPADDANGLVVIHRELLEDPEQQHVVVGVVDCITITENVEKGTRTPTARFLRIEAVIDPDSAAVIQALLRKLHEARCGRTPLPGLEEDEPRERLPYRDSE